MAPKKTRAQVSSQAEQQPQRSSRGGRKRKASDASNVSERPTSSQSAVPSSASSTPAKRGKRGKAVIVTEQSAIIEEDEEDELNQQADTQAGATSGHNLDELEEPKSIQVSQSSTKQVHFGGALTQDDGIDAGPSTATNITPHPRKMGIKRRFTASPGEEVNGIGIDNGMKRIKITTRSSLPGNASQEPGSPLYMLEEREFAPLREVLLDRIRRLEQKKESGELKDDMLVLDCQEIAYPRLPVDNASGGVEVDAKVTTIIEERLSQSQSQSKMWDEERRQFQDSILALSREANDNREKLNILNIELQALGFASDAGGEIDIHATVSSIREAFNRIRESLMVILPDTLPEDVNNEDLLDVLIANLREFAHRLQLQDKELGEKNTLIEELSGQVQGLLDHLAEAELRKQKLEQRWSELDQSIEDKDRAVEELQEEIQLAQEDRDALEAELEVKKTELRNVSGENVDFAKTVTRLSESLEHYRAEETRLQAIIVRMEETHRELIANMNKEREETVADLEDRLDEETKLLGDATQQSTERQTIIDALELRIAEVETTRDGLTEELAEVKTAREAEKQARELAEADLVERTEEVEDLETRVDRLEQELAELNTQLETLRQLNETERGQREAAEDDLDDRNVQIDELNRKLHEAGLQANELRTQLFGAQEDKRKKISDLELLISERDERYQTDIKAEVDRREDVEDLSQEREGIIADLEARLTEVEQRMLDLVAERDAKIDAVEGDVVQKEGEIESLDAELRDVQVRFDNYVAQSGQKIEDLEGSIVALKNNIADREEKIGIMQQEAIDATALHDSEMDDRNSRIAELNHSVAELKKQLEKLDNLKIGLERRVEQEAEQMLQLQSQKDDEIDDLEQKIRDQHALQLNVEHKARAADARAQEILAAKEQEIEELVTNSNTSTETISVLTADIEAIRAKFAEYVEFASGRIADMQAAFAQAKAVVDDGGYVQTEGERALQEVASLITRREFTVTKSQTVTAQSSSHAAVQKGKVTRGKKRVKDSGIGMEEDEDGMLAA